MSQQSQFYKLAILLVAWGIYAYPTGTEHFRACLFALGEEVPARAANED